MGAADVRCHLQLRAVPAQARGVHVRLEPTWMRNWNGVRASIDVNFSRTYRRQSLRELRSLFALSSSRSPTAVSKPSQHRVELPSQRRVARPAHEMGSLLHIAPRCWSKASRTRSRSRRATP